MIFFNVFCNASWNARNSSVLGNLRIYFAALSNDHGSQLHRAFSISFRLGFVFTNMSRMASLNDFVVCSVSGVCGAPWSSLFIVSSLVLHFVSGSFHGF